MPDITKQTVSASQAAALFGHSPYSTRWLLWQHFKNNVPTDPPEDTRMSWGKLMQAVILRATADQYRLEMQPNLADDYVRLGQLGCTLDGEMLVPDGEPIIVEAKNVDWLRWRDTWTESSAPLYVEIQLQEQLLVRQRQRGNEMKFYEREANPKIHERLKEEAASFFESLAADNEPDPLGSPLELPALAHLYPDSDPTEVLEDMKDVELSETIRMFDWARAQESFHRKIKEQMQAKLLARSGSAGIVRAPGVKAYITKSPIAASVCLAHAEDKVTRKASTQTRIKVEAIEGEDLAPEGAWAA
jgi:predicted phage-related endonuclease